MGETGPSACSATRRRDLPELVKRMKASGPRASKYRHRPDLRRPAQRLSADRLDRRRAQGQARERSEGRRGRRPRLDEKACSKPWSRLLGCRRADARLRQQHPSGRQGRGLENAFAFPGFVPAYIRPLFCAASARSLGSAFRAIPRISTRPTPKVKELLPDNSTTTGSTWRVNASPSRACRSVSAGVGPRGDRHRLALAFNEMVKNGELSAPVVIGRDHLDSARASPEPARRKR